MSMNVRILRASGRLEPFIERINAAIEEGIGPIRERLQLPEVDVVVMDDPEHAIPETGVGGFAPNANLLFIDIDPESPHLNDSIEEAVKSTLAHELHHCARWNALGYGKTLLEAMVSEGLADRFDMEVNVSEPRPWSLALTEAQAEVLDMRAKDELDNDTYDHAAWFFGSKEKDLPRWTGYSLGYRLVSAYMARCGKTAAELVGTPAREFL